MTETKTETATFAGGCFWCMDAEFSGISGVSRVVSGYTGGHTKNPTYHEVCSGRTGHFEAIEVTFDPGRVSYATLLDIFWHNIDPLDPYGQFCDKGSQYRAGIFYHNDGQRILAEASRTEVRKLFEQDISTITEPAAEFYPAEGYHQDYYIKSKLRYKLYRFGSGRDSRLRDLWKNKPQKIIP
jgi:peptide-methionine (S)-S-oxide reductase